MSAPEGGGRGEDGRGDAGSGPMRPVDLLVAGYLAVAPLALLGSGRPSSWPLLLLVHGAAIAGLLHLASRHPGGSAPGGDRLPALGWLREWYPLLIIPFLYKELPLLNQALGAGYRDGVVVAAEGLLFGTQPARTLAGALPWTPLSEYLHASYLSYYPIIYAPPLLLYLRGRRGDFAGMVFAVMATFFVCYLFFIFFPVEGPRYAWPPPAGVPDGPVRGLTLLLLESGSARGAAFPSSHVAVAVTQTWVAARTMPKLAPVVGVLAAGLAVGAVYGGFHYATDAVAGALLAAVVAPAALRVHRRLASGG